MNEDISGGNNGSAGRPNNQENIESKNLQMVGPGVHACQLLWVL